MLSFVAILADSYTKSESKDTELCMSCHEDPELYMEKEGRQISLFVNNDHYKNSVHAGAECVDCHTGYNAEELPHTKVKQEVNCASCHDDLKGIEKSVHKKVDCYDCHTKHDVKPVKDVIQNQTDNCLSCHKNKNIQLFKTSVHSKNNIECADCHQGGHSSKKISKNEVTATCGKCHNDSKMEFKNSVHHTVFSGGNPNAPVCTDCHGAHQIFESKISIESKGCLNCHLNEKLFPGDKVGSAKFVATYKTSIHASLQKGDIEAAGCVDCHGDHMIQSSEDPKSSTKRATQIETCGKCHGDVVEKFKLSKHGEELMKNNDKAPTCSDCHGEHDIKSTLLSNEFSKINIADKCLSCHKDGKLSHKNYKGEEELVTDYKNSAHYKALERGNIDAATCSDCHGAHEMDKFDDTLSRINIKNIAQTCGQSNCHVREVNEYKGSIHDSGIQNNNPDAPTCNTCHGNHVILKFNDKENRLSSAKGIVQTCSDCHDSKQLTDKNSMNIKQVETYNESLHGIYVRFGNKNAATCASCHTNHNIRSQDDPRSTVNNENITVTCGQSGCHTNVTANFVSGKIHIDTNSKESGIIYYISAFFKYFTFLILISLFIYIVLDLISKIRDRRRAG